MESEVIIQRFFVSTFIKRREKKKAIPHSYLKTKPNWTKTPTQWHALARASVNDLSSQRVKASWPTSKATQKASEVHSEFPFFWEKGRPAFPPWVQVSAAHAVAHTTSWSSSFHLQSAMLELQIRSLAQAWERPLPGETNLRTSNVAAFKYTRGLVSCWYRVYPKNPQGRKHPASLEAASIKRWKLIKTVRMRTGGVTQW